MLRSVEYVAGSIPGRVIRNSLKMVVIATVHGAQDWGLSLRLTGLCQDKWNISTDNLTRKHRGITENIFNTNQLYDLISLLGFSLLKPIGHIAFSILRG